MTSIGTKSTKESSCNLKERLKEVFEKDYGIKLSKEELNESEVGINEFLKCFL